MDRRDYFGSFGQLLPTERKIDEARKVLIFTLENDEGEEIEHELPIRFCVCGTCEGSGKHVNPSIDAHGITSEEWDRDWDPEEREGYFRGDYDVTCSECNGERVVPEIDEEGANKETLKILRDWQKSEIEYRACVAAERRYGV